MRTESLCAARPWPIVNRLTKVHYAGCRQSHRIQLKVMQSGDALFRLDGKVALVVGAASGIGRSAARGLAAAGAHVVCADLNDATAVAESIGSAESILLDITDEAAVTSTVTAIQKKHGHIDILVSTPAV